MITIYYRSYDNFDFDVIVLKMDVAKTDLEKIILNLEKYKNYIFMCNIRTA